MSARTEQKPEEGPLNDSLMMDDAVLFALLMPSQVLWSLHERSKSAADPAGTGGPPDHTYNHNSTAGNRPQGLNIAVFPYYKGNHAFARRTAQG